MTVIVLIRRVAKSGHVQEFLTNYKKERPIGKEGFITEYLTRVEGANLPGLRELGLLHPGKDGVAFLNVAFWKSEENSKRPSRQKLKALIRRQNANQESALSLK